MITYFYWFVVALLIIAILYLLGKKLDMWKPALLGGLIMFVVSVGAYYFHFQQIFVKRYGGVMTIKVPAGQLHVAATWKDDNLWVENFDPKTNTCHFSEYSRGNLLEGRVTIKNCNPIRFQQDGQQPDSPSPLPAIPENP